jgi:hypothetical protein
MNHANRRGSVRAGVLAFLFVVACTAGGVVIAAYWERPLYRSTAVLRTPAGTTDGWPTVYPLPIGAIPEMLRSERLITMATLSDVWKEHGLKPWDPASYARHVDCVLHPESQTIEISVLGADANSASVALTALMRSYLSLDENMRGEHFNRRINISDTLYQTLLHKLASLAMESEEVASRYGSDRLQPTLDFTRSQLEKIESLQLDLKIGVANQNHAATSAPAASGDTDAMNAREQRLAKLHHELRAKQLEIANAARRMSELDEERASVKDRLHEVKGRSEQLTIESMFVQNFLLNEANIPKEPECRWCSHRVKWSAGFSGGGALLLVLLIAAFYRGS